MNSSQEITTQIARLIQRHVDMSGLHQPQQLLASIESTIKNATHQTSTAPPPPPPPPHVTPSTTAIPPPPKLVMPTPLTPQNSIRHQEFPPSLRRSDSSASFNSSASLRRSDSSASLRRSDSATSFSSSSSGRNVARRLPLSLDDEAGFDLCFQTCRRQRRRSDKTTPKMKVAVKIVTKPVLRLLDDPYLSAKNSNLFKRKFKKGGKKNRKLRKKNAEIVGTLFKVLVVPTLKILFTREYTSAKNQEPGLSPFEFRQRLFNAALKVVRKRRANHVQSWRLNNCPKPLIYSDANHRLPDDLFDQKDNHDSDTDVYDSTHDGTEEDFEESQCPIPLSQPVDFSEDDICDEDASPAAAAASAVVSPSLPPPPVNMFRVKTKCCACGAEVDFNSGFPQDKENDWSDKKVRCEACWDKHVQNTMLKEIEDPAKRKKKLNEILKNNNKKRKQSNSEEAVGNSNSKTVEKSTRKRRRLTQCKWCNSTTHKTKRSKKCPFNPRNKQAAQPPAPQPPKPQQQPPAPQQQPPAPQQQTPAPPPPQRRGPGPATPPIPVRCRLNIGDNCLAQFKGGWYRAQVFDFDDPSGTYSVYFPSDGMTKTRVRPQALRAPSTTSASRREFQDKEFYFDGDTDLPPGRWKVRRIIHKKNTFMCGRLTGEGNVNMDEFDIGYVMRQVKKEQEGFRENGPRWIPPGL